jgi:hypothetical protein
MHHVAQKFSTTTLPRWSVNEWLAPSIPSTVKLGAVAPGVVDALVDPPGRLHAASASAASQAAKQFLIRIC